MGTTTATAIVRRVRAFRPAATPVVEAESFTLCRVAGRKVTFRSVSGRTVTLDRSRFDCDLPLFLAASEV